MSKVISSRTCWVPTCKNNNNDLLKKKIFSLSSTTPKLRETWLALATKSAEGISDDQIFFCEDHFQAINLEFTIDNTFYSQQQNAMIPTRNMPDQVCRTCNEFIGMNEPLFTMSTWVQVDMPKAVQDQLTNMINPVNPSPLYQMFGYCFTEFKVPSDPVPIICNKCYENIWLFFSYKKNAIDIEDMLSQDFTPEEYGKTVLCRTCTIERSNFFHLDEVSELGTLLQDILVKRFPSKLVPLRVCLNCHSILNKINGFHKTFMNTEKIIKRRSLLNEKLKLANSNSPRTLLANQIGDKEELFKKCEKENLILAQLMLQYGENLRNNLHIIDNWTPICQKLEEHKINHNVPSLINNWKRLQKIAQEKALKNTRLSELEELVLKFVKLTSNKSDREVTRDNDSSVHVRKDSLKQLASPALKHENKEFSSANITKKRGRPPKFLKNKCYIEGIFPKAGRAEDIIEERKNTKMALAESTLADEKKSSANTVLKRPYRKNSIKYSDKILFAKAVCEEFHKLPVEERTKRHIWKQLIKEVYKKRVLPQLKFPQLYALWINLKRSATIYEKNGSDEVDNLIWGILKKIKDEKDKPKSPLKTETKTEGSDHYSEASISNTNKPTLKEEPSNVGSIKHQLNFTNSNITKLNKNPPEQIVKRQLFIAIKDAHKRLVENGKRLPTKRVWHAIFDELFNSQYFDLLSREDAEEMWTVVRRKAYTDFWRQRPLSPFYREVHEFVGQISKSRKEQIASSNKDKTPSNPPKIKAEVPMTDEQEKSNNAELGRDISVIDEDVLLKRQLFTEIKYTFKEMRRRNMLKKGKIWRDIFNIMYNDRGFDLIERPQAEVMWNSIKLKANTDTIKGKPTSDFNKEVFRFIQKTKKALLAFENEPKKRKIVENVKTFKKARFKPNTASEADKTTAEKILADKIAADKKVADKIAADKKEADKRAADKAIANKTLIDNSTNKSISSVVQKTVTQEKIIKESGPVIMGKDANQLKFWSDEEKLNYLSVMYDNQQYLDDKKEFWLKVVDDFKKDNKRHLSDTCILMQWQNLQERLGLRRKNKVELDDVDKKVEDLMDIIKSSVQNKTKSSNDTSSNKSTTANNVKYNDKNVKTSDSAISVSKSDAGTKIIKKEMTLSQASTSCDLTYDDYVSLEDLQQSTTWDMPNLKIEQNEINIEIAKVEGGVAMDTSIHNGGGEDSRENKEDVTMNQSYVGADDILAIETDSDEE